MTNSLFAGGSSDSPSPSGNAVVKRQRSLEVRVSYQWTRGLVRRVSYRPCTNAGNVVPYLLHRVLSDVFDWSRYRLVPGVPITGCRGVLFKSAVHGLYQASERTQSQVGIRTPNKYRPVSAASLEVTTDL